MLVRGAGLEPARSFDQEILSLSCIPIPPPAQSGVLMEARMGVEPIYELLQSSA